MSVRITDGPGVVSRIFTAIKNGATKKSPELLVIGGTVAFVATLVSMRKTTLKTKEIVDNANDQVDAINNTPKSAEYTDEDAFEDIKKVKRASAVKLVKAAVPTIVLALGTISCFWGADYIRKQRHAALFAAAEMTMHSYENYRKGVIEKYGPDVDKELKYKLFRSEQEVEVTDEKTGRKKRKKETVWETNYDGYSQFARIFDEYHPKYQRLIVDSRKYPNDDAPYGMANLDWVLCQQKAANQKLRREGRLVLNDVYEMLQYEKTEEGALAGWVWDINDQSCLDDMHIDFGIFDYDKETWKAIMLGKEKSFVIDFNIDTLDVYHGVDNTPTFGLLPGRNG